MSIICAVSMRSSAVGFVALQIGRNVPTHVWFAGASEPAAASPGIPPSPAARAENEHPASPASVISSAHRTRPAYHRTIVSVRSAS